MLRRHSRAARASSTSVQRRAQGSKGGNSMRNQYKDMSEPGTGQQLGLAEPPDMTAHIAFLEKSVEHVSIPEIPIEKRYMTDLEKDEQMRKKYGELGPGERPTKTAQQMKKDMLDKQQDIDGLPWEVRWRKALIPTKEEIVQDMRDRFEMWVPDPIDREEQWYLQWRDKGYLAAPDRLIWPQGYTDYQDQYDENGRRRTLPTDQRWSDTTWKHLADTKYRDRMWLVGAEERKTLQKTMQSEEVVQADAQKLLTDQTDVYMGVTMGVLDFDQDQITQALAGTSDPLEVAKAKFKLSEYYAERVAKLGDKSGAPEELDPITGMPKSSSPPLKSGLTVEQAAAIESRVTMLKEGIEEKSTLDQDHRRGPPMEFGHQTMEAGKRAGEPDRPQHAVRHLAEVAKEKILKAQENYRAELAANKAQAQGTDTTASIGKESPGQISDGVPQTTSAAPASEPSKQATSSDPTKKEELKASGFIEVPPRPDHSRLEIEKDILAPAPVKELNESPPEWYIKSVIEPGPMIYTYGITKDPLEMKEVNPKYIIKPSKKIEEVMVLADQATLGDSVFDEAKINKQKLAPEFVVEMKPLPLYKDVVKEKEESKLTKSKSQQLADQRRERNKRLSMDSDLLLPDLPFESDSVSDPYKGVSKVDVPFDKKEVEACYKVYKGFMTQRLMEFNNMAKTVTAEKAEMVLRDGISKIRVGDVGNRPAVDSQIDEVFRVQFEAHIKQYLVEIMKIQASRKDEAEALRAEAEELLRKATAKGKLCGQKFIDFIQEMTAIEMDKIKANPIQRYTITVADKKHEILGKPFIRWISHDLNPFIKMEFMSHDQLEQHREILFRSMMEARHKCPARVEGVTDGVRDLVVEAFAHWCKGSLLFHTGKHYMDLHLRFADGRFKSRSEELCDQSIECFQNYHSYYKQCNVLIPVPHSEPYYHLRDTEYLEGEDASVAEAFGDMEKAERIWTSGTTMRWYPMFDETDVIHYYERRGKVSSAFDASDRCLDALNKKTHPSVHPFPERAKIYLEGAPVSQETAEHLWLRYMGDVYVEHADVHVRCGKAQTAKDLLDQALNYYHVALRTATERLPASWSAPLLTKAKLMCRTQQDKDDVWRYIAEVEKCIDEMYALGDEKTKHWMEKLTDLPYRVALLTYAGPAFAAACALEAQKLANHELDAGQITEAVESRAKLHVTPPRFERIESALDITAEKRWRSMIIRFRSKEQKMSDSYHVLTLLYFLIRVRPKSTEECQRLYDMFHETYDYFYTQTALGQRSRGRLFHDVVRRLCQILAPGSMEQKKLLFAELEKLNEKMRHALNGDELDRTIKSMELHFKDPSKPPYIYGSETAAKRNREFQGRAENPLLRVSHGKNDYDRLRESVKDLRKGTGDEKPAVQQGQGNEDESKPVSRKTMLKKEIPGL